MILIADSGSTKTIWAAKNNNFATSFFQTKGYNPYHVQADEIVSDLLIHVPENICKQQVEQIYFFGAGCSNAQNKSIITQAVKSVFPNAYVKVASDIEGAAMALFGKEKGIVCILGTGSNAAIWDGNKPQQHTPPLGYILGDEGSGTHMGIRFLKKYLRKEFDNELLEYFHSKIEFSDAEIMNMIYKSSDTKRFLASFVPLLSSRIENPEIEQIVIESFRSFFSVFILKIPEYKEFPVGFCGSPAFFFKNILAEVASEYDVQVEKIIINPIEELVRFYCGDFYKSK